MVDIHSLMRALPVYGLEPQTLAYIPGFPRPKMNGETYVADSIGFLEPPAGQHVPYVEPIDFMQRIFVYHGMDATDALNLATEQYNKLRQSLSVFERPVYYDYFPKNVSTEHVSTVALLKHMRENKLASGHLIDFFENASETTKLLPLFNDTDGGRHRLIDLPDYPSTKAMIEFAPVPWSSDWDDDPIFWDWREEMKPIIVSLEKELGESICHYDDPDDDDNDECVHRFLILHWNCSYKPSSSYVHYILEASGATDVEELKAALINPEYYLHPFEMHNAYCDPEVLPCRSMTYLPPGKRKITGVVFATEDARQVAESILLQQIGADVIIAAPEKLLYDTSIPEYLKGNTLCKQATRFCQYLGSFFLQNGQIKEPITFLARIDELYVVADDITPNPNPEGDLALSDSIEELLWKATDLKIPAHYYSVDGFSLSNPGTCLQRRNVPERVAVKDKARKKRTSDLTIVRLDCDWSSSGLWDELGRMISYDYIDLPLPLIRRIIDWHKEFDATLDTGFSDEWEERHEREKHEIALELQNALGPGIAVQVITEQGWTAII